MTDVINVETVDRLSRVYSHVDDIDLFTGGLSERPVTGGVVGPTFACIIGQQFLNLRKGDRFWYENGNHPGAFKADQLQEIRRASLSRVICDNLDDIESLQPFAFLTVDGFSNQRKACKGTGKMKIGVRFKNSVRSKKRAPYFQALFFQEFQESIYDYGEKLHKIRNNYLPSIPFCLTICRI